MDGLSVDIFRSGYNSELNKMNGIKGCILTGGNVPEISSPTKDTPELKLIKRYLFGSEYLSAEPVEPPDPGTIGYMFGGTFIYTSDSRFPSKQPIPVHDRQESQAMYNQLST